MPPIFVFLIEIIFILTRNEAMGVKAPGRYSAL